MPRRNFKNKNNSARIAVGAGRYLAPCLAFPGLPALWWDFQPRSLLSQVGARDARVLSNAPNLRRLVPDDIFFTVTQAERKRVAPDLGVVNVARLGVNRHSFDAGAMLHDLATPVGASVVSAQRGSKIFSTRYVQLCLIVTWNVGSIAWKDWQVEITRIKQDAAPGNHRLTTISV